MRSTQILKILHQLASEALEKSHSPYSGFRIGAAVLMKDGQVFSGTNIENASYGGTVCAERVAIWKAISEGAQSPIVHMMVVTETKEAWPPCGFCRQVIAEFCLPTTKISLGTKTKVTATMSFSKLLPKAFLPQHLSASKKTARERK